MRGGVAELEIGRLDSAESVVYCLGQWRITKAYILCEIYIYIYICIRMQYVYVQMYTVSICMFISCGCGGGWAGWVAVVVGGE